VVKRHFTPTRFWLRFLNQASTSLCNRSTRSIQRSRHCCESTMWRFTPMLIDFVAVMVVGCAVLALLLSWVTGIDLLTGYLATTPGGM